MLAKGTLAAALAALVLAPASLAQARVLMPGVTYERDVEFTAHGPVVAHVLRGPRPVGLYALKPILSNELVVGRERVTQMQRRVSAGATVAGVNGDVFDARLGYPSGIQMLNGLLVLQPHAERASTGIGPDGSLRVERVRFAGTWQGTGQRRPFVLNRDPGPNGVTLYTSTYGVATPPAADTVELVLAPFPPAQPLRDLVASVVQTKQGGATPIPPGSAVLVGRGANGGGRLAAEAPPGTSVTVRLTLTPDWSGLVDAIGGGPLLVRDGRPVFRSGDVFTIAQLLRRQARTAVGQTREGRILLVTVDGARPGYSVGVTNFELALLLARLGAVTASALDGGDSATMAFEGRLLNRPSDPSGERAVANSLNLFYYGVHVPEPAAEVVSPNGDGVDERQALAYKVVRASTVNARLVGPDGAVVAVDAGARSPGAYRFTWSGPGAEGAWRFVVDATDDLGRASRAERAFSLNTTLASLSVPSIRRRATLRAAFTLARPAQVRATVLTATGARVASIGPRSLGTGAQTLTWGGRTASGGRVRPGAYELRVTAQNETGTMSLSAPFAVRR